MEWNIATIHGVTEERLVQLASASVQHATILGEWRPILEHLVEAAARTDRFFLRIQDIFQSQSMANERFQTQVVSEMRHRVSAVETATNAIQARPAATDHH
jgi:hypothetical protein